MDGRGGRAKKKVLLMGKSGSGKTSMRSVIFSNHLAESTKKLGATIEVEQSQHRFLSDLMLNLWDCGGQEAFMENYLRHDQNQIFSNVQLLIYVFDISAKEYEKERDFGYYTDCLNAIKEYSPDASIFVLIHKMDLVPSDKRNVFLRKKKELLDHSEDVPIRVFGTSIWDESLYRAWSRIVHTLVPNAQDLTNHLDEFVEACSAIEAVIFEKKTMLLIAWSTEAGDFSKDDLDDEDDREIFERQTPPDQSCDQSNKERCHPSVTPVLPPDRFEKISEIIKRWKNTLLNSKMNFSFQNWVQEWSNFTAVLEPLTVNTFILVIAADPDILPGALRLNIEMAKERFIALQAGRSR
ncbi:ras-related GTP-binding protein-like protein raga [Dacryopinax primogenitus]|uniref:GTP-binding protein n=1 Tax=Dacryopinax primogenitus (strain DJM 731) TaxID=1858805 RepID=M5FWN3_DACPD|nr:ras-related GTP-binding protein-like protein raga [Dacryopinax primogenitus]EJU00799.1 ras-related GTP-binding protein-like protein raga [Dacryopinax primogenitus]